MIFKNTIAVEINVVIPVAMAKGVKMSSHGSPITRNVIFHVCLKNCKLYTRNLAIWSISPRIFSWRITKPNTRYVLSRNIGHAVDFNLRGGAWDPLWLLNYSDIMICNSKGQTSNNYCFGSQEMGL